MAQLAGRLIQRAQHRMRQGPEAVPLLCQGRDMVTVVWYGDTVIGSNPEPSSTDDAELWSGSLQRDHSC